MEHCINKLSHEGVHDAAKHSTEHVFPSEYQAWRATMVKLRKADLVTHMDSIIKSMAQRLITRVQKRMAPHQSYLDAYCLVDPFSVLPWRR